MKLTNKELNIIQDSDFLLTKVKIISKIFSLLEITEQNLRELIKGSKFNFPSGTKTKYGKISKGEAYKNLPYMVLDYPSLFTHEDVFSYRTMFWWSNFFSCTLHLQGNSLEKFREIFKNNIDHLLKSQIYIGVGENPWEYHYKKNNYVLLSKSNLDLLNKHSFLKLSKKIELIDYQNLPKYSTDFLRLLLGILT